MGITKVYTLPAGEYWVGDPCYFLHGDTSDGHSRWDALLKENDCFGKAMIEFEGHVLIGFGAAYGDGECYDQQGRAYPVDAGLIGMVPVALVTEQPWADAGHKITFTSPVECHEKSGVLTFGDIVIDTMSSEEGDEE